MADENFEKLMGFKFIRDMSRKELVEEILEHQRECLRDKESTELKSLVVSIRLEEYKRKLVKEANLKIEPGFLGMGGSVSEVDDD